MLIFLQLSIGTRAVVTSSRHRPFCFHNFVFLLNCLFVLYRATRISVCVIAVSKSHEFLLKVRRLSSFFSTTTPTPSRRRVVILSRTTQGIRLRRRVDVFSTTSDNSQDQGNTLLGRPLNRWPYIFAMVTKWTQQCTHEVTRHTDAEAPTFNFEYRAQQTLVSRTTSLNRTRSSGVSFWSCGRSKKISEHGLAPRFVNPAMDSAFMSETIRLGYSWKMGL